MDLTKAIAIFSAPGLGLVRHNPNGQIGIAPAVLDALCDEPYLALQLRAAGYRQPIAGVTDCPGSRVILDALAIDINGAAVEAAALLTGEVDGVLFRASILHRLLQHTPDLPLPSVAALEAPHDVTRRPFVRSWLERLVASGRLPNGTVRGHVQIDRRDYAAIADRPAPSVLVDAWLRRSTAHFTR